MSDHAAARPVTIVAIGAGNRTNKYLEYAVRHPERLQLVGVVEKKVEKLDKYFDEDAVCSVYLKQEGKYCKTEVTIYYKGNMVRAEVSSDNFYDNIDAVLPKIERQIYKHKSKIESKLKLADHLVDFLGAHTLFDVLADIIEYRNVDLRALFDSGDLIRLNVIVFQRFKEEVEREISGAESIRERHLNKGPVAVHNPLFLIIPSSGELRPHGASMESGGKADKIFPLRAIFFQSISFSEFNAVFGCFCSG